MAPRPSSVSLLDSAKFKLVKCPRLHTLAKSATQCSGNEYTFVMALTRMHVRHASDRWKRYVKAKHSSVI